MQKKSTTWEQLSQKKTGNRRVVLDLKKHNQKLYRVTGKQDDTDDKRPWTQRPMYFRFHLPDAKPPDVDYSDRQCNNCAAL